MPSFTPEEFEALPLREQFRLIAPLAATDPKYAPVLQALAQSRETDPLAWFEPHPARNGHRPQLEFIEADTPVVAAFAGNQFGKSTVLTVCALRESLPRNMLPPLLERTKRYEAPTDGWILCPTEDKIFDSFQPAFEEWTPKSAFKGGSWGKAFNGARMMLSFANGSSIAFKTYKQDPSTLGGARLHWVGYDEPPPKKHREESRMRLVRYGGHEMFAMTPLDTNTTYVRRAIWKQRESRHITVVRGSIHDNPTLDSAQVELALGDLSDIWRRAREHGEFVDIGGLIFPEFERCVVKEPWSLEFIRSLDVVIGIDPGIRNAGFAWVGFDKDSVAYVFNEGLLQDKEAPDYAAFIHAENRRLGLKDVAYVCDPQMRARGQVNAETVMGSLAQNGIFANIGQNSHEAGFDQMRSRMARERFFVSPECRGLRDEADDYAAKEPAEDGDDSHLNPVSNQFHRMDALRYAVMERFWDPMMEQAAPDRRLGWEPGQALPARFVVGPGRESAPMGSMS